MAARRTTTSVPRTQLDFAPQHDFDAVASLPTAEQLENLKSFVEEHATELRNVEEALDDALTEVWDVSTDPIALHFDIEEDCNVRELLQTDNKVVLKVLTVFSVIGAEVNTLQNTALEKFYPVLSIFGEIPNNEELAEGDAVLMVSRVMPLLEDLCHFVKRCHHLVKNMVSQLASLFNEKQKLYQQTFKGVYLTSCFRYIGDVLKILISLDAIIQSNDELLQCWSQYKKMLRSCTLEPSMFGVEEDKLESLQISVNSVESELLQGSIFRNCIAQEFDWLDEQSVQEARLNRTFMEIFNANLKIMLNYLAGHIGDSTESDHQQQFVSLTGLYVLYSSMMRGRDIDKKLHKAVMMMTRKIPLVHIYGRAVWLLDDFVYTMLPAHPRVTDDNFIQSFCKSLDDTFLNEVQALYLQVCTWMVRMESGFSAKVPMADMLNQRTNLLIQGVLLCYQAANLGKINLFLHLQLGSTFRASNVRGLGQCMEMLKAVQAVYYRRSGAISDHIAHMSRYLAMLLEKVLTPLKGELETQLGSGKKGSWRQDDIKLDMLSQMTLMVTTLRGPPTVMRRLLLNLTWDMMHKKSIRDQDQDEIRLLLRKMDLVCSLQEHLSKACDTSFLYWCQDLFPTFFQDIFSKPEEANRLHYLVAALREPVRTVSKAEHLAHNLAAVESYKKSLESDLESNVIEPLCRDIETDLRLHIHSAAIEQLDVAPNPLKQGLNDLSPFVKLRPLRFFDVDVDIKARLTHYLDTTFYNLTTVALHDWKTYGEMRNLVQQKYGITLTETHLPTGTLEQGLDVLEIMRNIHVFVSRFDYNLNTQMFVQRPTDNKYLNTIGIRQIANSIRTHGTGIMNTTVNYTYQFLARKFVVFSQFLFDDHIKSRLIKDIRYFKQNKETIDNKYPFDRAEKFNKDIRKLGAAGADNATYLDKFRELLTEIGNALGYVRMIRAGGLNYCANAIKFVPDLSDVLEFEEAVKKENLSSETTAAAKNLDSVLEDLTRKFAEGTDFFQLLADVFSTELRSDRNEHLKNFFVIIPPLCVNFVEHIMKCKDRLIKNAKRGLAGCFTDDGFAIGVAYILKVLDQNNQFDSLHWFDSVKKQMAEERAKLDAQKAEKRKANDEEMASMQLAYGRLQTRMMEFDQVYFSISGARIFFKD